MKGKNISISVLAIIALLFTIWCLVDGNYWEDIAGNLFGAENKAIFSLDCYAEDSMALSRDLYRISQIIDYLYQTDLVNIILIDGYQINYGQLYYLGEVFETLF